MKWKTGFDPIKGNINAAAGNKVCFLSPYMKCNMNCNMNCFCSCSGQRFLTVVFPLRLLFQFLSIYLLFLRFLFTLLKVLLYVLFINRLHSQCIASCKRCEFLNTLENLAINHDYFLMRSGRSIFSRTWIT